MKIAVAMSGGVDSSVVAKILKDEGHDLVGLFLKLWSDLSNSCATRKENRCCDYQALEDARMVASRLDIPFYVINATVEFKKEVVDYFLNEYKNLRTPNPCIVCNQTIKFDLLLRKALSIGCDKLATGHYARIAEGNSGNSKFQIPNSKQIINAKESVFKLFKGIDDSKDQSYMLYRLNQNQLSKIIFPLGEMLKKDVRNLALKWDMPVKEKPESQEICFFADRDYRSFLGRYLNKKYFLSGEIVDTAGNVVGKHDGLLNYTIGQRKLLDQEIWRKEQGDKKPLYVIGFDKEKNQLIVGSDKEIYKKGMVVGNLNFIHTPDFLLHFPDLSVKIRYRHPDFPCVIARSEATQQFDKVKVLFKKPQRAVTPGQSAVFYAGDKVIGGGIIEN